MILHLCLIDGSDKRIQDRLALYLTYQHIEDLPAKVLKAFMGKELTEDSNFGISPVLSLLGLSKKQKRSSGLSKEGKEPSAAYLSRLIDTSRTLKISKILYQKQFDKSTVEAIATELGLTPVVVDPLAENVVENIESLAHIIADSCSQ